MLLVRRTEPAAVPASGASMAQRLVRLFSGLVAFGVSIALMVESGLGLGPWDVLHQGLARRFGLDIGWVVIAVGVVALAAWIPLGERPGIGTVFNALLIGPVINLVILVLPSPTVLPERLLLLGAGILVNGLATGLYLGAGLGPGPRDGLMTGLAARGHSLRVVRTTIELLVLVAGGVLGGRIGVGTVAYALAIGPLAHWSLSRFDVAHPPHV